MCTGISRNTTEVYCTGISRITTKVYCTGASRITIGMGVLTGLLAAALVVVTMGWFVSCVYWQRRLVMDVHDIIQLIIKVNDL